MYNGTRILDLRFWVGTISFGMISARGIMIARRTRTTRATRAIRRNLNRVDFRRDIRLRESMFAKLCGCRIGVAVASNMCAGQSK